MTAGHERMGRADVSRLLYLDSAPARCLVLLFVAANVTFVVTTKDLLVTVWPSLVAMVLVSATAVLLVRSRPDPFPWADTLIVLTVVGVSTLLMSIALPGDEGLGRAVWHLGANTWLLFFVALRRRAWVSWIGMGVMVAITAGWGVTTGLGPLVGITMMQSHIGILLVGTLFAMILRTTALRINIFNERSVVSAVDAAATDAARQVRRARVAELASVAVPLLEKIASGAPHPHADRGPTA